MPAAPTSTIPDVARRDTPSGYQRVVSLLGEQLMAGSLKVGDRLLPERELALQLSVSRPIVREALRSLAMIGLLEIRHGHGTFVRAPDIASLGDFFTFALAQQTDVTGDILEVRIAIERQAIRLACTRARAHDLQNIAEAFHRIVATIEDPVAGGHADYHFHAMLVQASHSPALVRIYSIVSDLLMTSHVARRERNILTPERRRFLIDHHEQVLRAVLNRDADESERLLALHFEIGADLNQNETAADAFTGVDR
ncbi:FadR/GntR family transcriptional regulator [Sphingomonas profundi]|uniref:FadR/GntR family transcriptional regulator n=1 Tax=Alterirhizorhabdus profundi TaxID=2681549 RepID=UPI0012E72354|nr:FadR/GntR family transcriptional regulator [Sphingomonas profundi]